MVKLTKGMVSRLRAKGKGGLSKAVLVNSIKALGSLSVGSVHAKRVMALMGKSQKDSPFPESRMCKLHFAKKLVLGSNASQNVIGPEWLLQMNSIYRPEFVNTPTTTYFRVNGYDQILPLWGKYKVSACKIDVEFTDPSADGIACYMAVQSPADGQTLTALTNDIALMKEGVLEKSLNNTGSQKTRFSQIFSIQKVCGLTSLQFKADDMAYNAQINTSPTQLPIFRIAIANLSATGIATCQAIVRVTYYTRLYNRYMLASSNYVAP